MAKDKLPTAAEPTLAREDGNQAQISKAWAELLEAAKTDPKARAFLEAYGPSAEDPIRQDD